MNRTGTLRTLLVARLLRLARVVALASPLLAGCGGDTTCFVWAEDACPARRDALNHMLACDDEACIQSVDSEGVKEDGACCYDVTKKDYNDCGGPFGGSCPVEDGAPLSLGAGPSGVPSSRVK